MTYSLNPSFPERGFFVPSDIVDKHIRLASGEQIKVLLLILGKAPKKLDENEIAKKLKYSVADVEDYLQYWVLTGVLIENESTQKSAAEKADEPKKYVPKSERKGQTPKEETDEIEYSRPSSAEIAVRMSESKEIANLFKELQAKLGKTIGYDGQCTFLLLYDRFGLPADVIFMLVDYCIKLNKTGYSYIETVGKTWANQEIDTIEKAAEKIASIDTINLLWNRFKAYSGISSPRPTAKQADYFEDWAIKKELSLDLICIAYDQMAENTGKVSFSYMNKVLENWCNSGIKTPEDLKKQKASSSAKTRTAATAPSDSEASYNLEDYVNNTIKRKRKYIRKNT